MKNVIVIVFAMVVVMCAHRCVHDERARYQQQEHVMSLEEMPLEFTYKRSVQGRPDHLPIRIRIAEDLLLNDPYTCYRVGDEITAESEEGGTTVTYTCTQDDVLTTSKKNYLINTLMKDAKEYLENVLSVIRATGNLRLGLTNCGGSPLSNPVPDSYQDPGYDTDFILFVTARPILNGAALAFASSCSTNGLGRPTAGHANFNVSNLVDFEGDRPRQLGIAIHEITHALGFSSGRFSTFIQWLDDGSYQRMSSSDINELVDRGGYTQYRIITPSVKEAVRLHFGCDTLEGADIEDGGSSGTAGSHWEKRVFMTEYMTGTANSFPVYSNITLALLYDSGWYEVDFSKAEFFTWGRDAGCPFYDGSCGSDDDWAGYRCTTGDNQLSQSIPTSECTQDLRGYGQCNQQTFSTDLPEWFQYFDNPKTGGHSNVADYCTYYIPQVTCTLGAEDLAAALDLDIEGISSTGQSFEYNSRCFKTTLLKLETGIKIFNDVIQSTLAPRCYNSTCVSSTDLRIQIDDVWVKCDPDGGVIETRDIPGYGGEITCPKAADVCAGSSYDSTWPVIYDVDPVVGKASTLITITGKNFLQTDNITVRVQGPCTNVEVVDDGTITCNIPGSDYFVDITDLSIFETKKDVIVIDGRGYSVASVDKFTIQIAFDEVYLASLWNWIKENPLWGVIATAIVISPILIILYCTCKACDKPKKPAKRKDKLVHKEDYYDDHFGVDDYYD